MPGYVLAPVEPLDSGLLCSECKLVLRDAVQTDEGNRLCRTCYEQTGVAECGECNPDRAADRDVKSLLVKCPNYLSGCPWQGTLYNLILEPRAHESQCQYQLQLCSNEGCGKQITKLGINDHEREGCPFRVVTCKHCQKKIIFNQLEDHYGECAEYPLPCMGCSVMLKRSQIQDHQCYFVKCLCGESFPETDLEDHVRNFRQNAEEQKVQDLVQSNPNPEAIQSNCFTESTQELSRLRRRATEQNQQVRDQINQFSLPSTATPPKSNNLEDRVSKLEQHLAKLLQLQASLASTHNGSFLWRIPDVRRRRKDAMEERITSIYSPPFYTGRNGYKMCIRAYLNGDGIGFKTHLSLFFVLMRGEYDPLLKWPFEYKVSLILVDQDHRKHIVQTFKPTPDSSSFKRPTSDMNVASGCPQFAKIEEYE